MNRPSPRSVASLPRILLSETLKYRSFPEALTRFARSACLTLDIIVLPPCNLEEIIYMYSSNLCPKYASETFFWLQMQNFLRPGRGETASQTPPPPRSFADRSLRSIANYNDEYIWNGMLKAWCYRLAPLLFGGNHILVIFAQNMRQKLFFRAPNAKFPLTWEPDPPPPPPPPRLVASLPSSAPRRSAHSDFRNPPQKKKKKNSGYVPGLGLEIFLTRTRGIRLWLWLGLGGDDSDSDSDSDLTIWTRTQHCQ